MILSTVMILNENLPYTYQYTITYYYSLLLENYQDWSLHLLFPYFYDFTLHVKQISQFCDFHPSINSNKKSFLDLCLSHITIYCNAREMEILDS